MMEISDKGKILILIMLVAIVIYLLSGNNKSTPIQNSGALQQSLTASHNSDTDSLPNNTDNSSTDSSNSSQSNNSLVNDLTKKMSTKNSALNGYKTSNYVDGNRNQNSNLDSFFNNENPLDQQNSGFASSTEGNQFASYAPGKPGKPGKQSDKDKFDAGALLPQEQNDWFDDPQSKKNVNSPHLINVYRHIGANTVQTTLKNPSWDIRGAPPNPKGVVSPWQNSSYEPDTNLKNGALCH